MKRVGVPGTEMSISRIAFGCARLAGGRELSLSAKLIESALEQGISHFDTAPFYGSESVLGQVLGDARDVTITTKVGLARSTETFGRSSLLRTAYRASVRPLLGKFPKIKSALLRASRGSGPPSAMIKRVLVRDEIHREFEESLRQLRRSRIDLYLIHEPENLIFSDEIADTFAALKSSGVIGAYGSGFGDSRPEGSLDFGTVDQCRYSAQHSSPQTSGRLTIFHGILRHTLHDPAANCGGLKADGLIAEVLKTHPASVILFSAGSTHQIRQVCSAAHGL